MEGFNSETVLRMAAAVLHTSPACRLLYNLPYIHSCIIDCLIGFCLIAWAQAGPEICFCRLFLSSQYEPL